MINTNMDASRECMILASRKDLYFILYSEIIPITCICTLKPPKEIIAVIIIILIISGRAKLLTNFTPWVISNIPEKKAFKIGGKLNI